MSNIAHFLFFNYFAINKFCLRPKINIPKAFFSFLVASFFIWLLINLSKEYTTTISYEILYKELSQHRIFEEEPLKEVKVSVKGSGFKLFSSNFHNKILVFSLDKIRNNSENRYYFLPKHQESEIQEQLYKGLQLDKVLKDTIFLKLSSLASKKVPIVPNITLNYEPGYDVTSPVKVVPDSVLISGPKLQIEKIDKITTELLQLDNISKNLSSSLKLAKPKELNKVKLSDRIVKLEVFVDKFTEGEFMLPFTIVNMPSGTKINTFPKKVNVVFKVPLSNFNKITPNSFQIVCDYKESKEKGLPYLIPKLDIKSNLISSVRILPKKIEFLTQK